MAEQPVVPGEAFEACRSVDVADTLADVNMDSDAEVLGESGRSLKRFVTAGEGGVDTDQRLAALLDEALVLFESAAGALGPVAIRDAVSTQDTHPDCGAGIGDHREGAFDGIGGLVVVDDRGGARLQRLERTELGGPVEHVEIEGSVEAPPDLLQDLLEVRWRLWRRRHAAGKRRVEVMMGADQSGCCCSAHVLVSTV